MIDTHCHLLHGLDDGPASLAGSVALAKDLARAGVREVVCTPHYSRRFPTVRAEAQHRLHEVRAGLKASGVAMTLHLAAEIAPLTAMEAPPDELGQRTFGDGRLLVELQRDTPASLVPLLLERLTGLGHRVVLAHPERCGSVAVHPRLLDDAREDGALVQVVASSLTGRQGREVATAAWRLLEAGRVDLLASDAHRARPEGPHLARAVGLIGNRLGEEAVRELTQRAPARLLRQADAGF